jgi:hypothetical protein
MPPPPAIPLASESFSHRLPQDLLIQGQVGDELLHLPVAALLGTPLDSERS